MENDLCQPCPMSYLRHTIFLLPWITVTIKVIIRKTWLNIHVQRGKSNKYFLKNTVECKYVGRKALKAKTNKEKNNK